MSVLQLSTSDKRLVDIVIPGLTRDPFNYKSGFLPTCRQAGFRRNDICIFLDAST